MALHQHTYNDSESSPVASANGRLVEPLLEREHVATSAASAAAAEKIGHADASLSGRSNRRGVEEPMWLESEGKTKCHGGVKSCGCERPACPSPGIDGRAGGHIISTRRSLMRLQRQLLIRLDPAWHPPASSAPLPTDPRPVAGIVDIHTTLHPTQQPYAHDL